MYGRDERENRRHAWSAVDTREAVCTRCDARTRVSLVVTPAGVRAAIARHGPERCPGRKPWWRTNYWYGTQAEPARPWADDEITPSSSTGGPVRRELEAAADRTDTAARPTAPVGSVRPTGRPLADVLDPDEGDDEIAPSSSTDGPDRHEYQANASDRTDAAAIDEGELCGDCGWPSSSKPSRCSVPSRATRGPQ